ncbi:MAG: hypothetical protein MMC23_001248 [Stictis urceolatum]|nr:hypothetical protein [Stictis urceolata]
MKKMDPIKECPSSSATSDPDSDSDYSVEITTDQARSAPMSPATPNTPADGEALAAQALATQRRADRNYHRLFLSSENRAARPSSNAATEECRTVPLFSGSVLDSVTESTFTQYGLLGGEVPGEKQVDLLGMPEPESATEKDERIFLNVSPPWSAFICGSQGSGKSHTLSCMLENCLLPSKLGKLQHPLTGIVFHYDKFTSYGGNQLCEAAYLCSSNIPVKVLVSPTNFWNMRERYSELPGLAGKRKPEVVPMKFRDKQLDVSRMMVLMAVSDQPGPTPLYIEVMMRILREMAITSKGRTGLDYALFRQKLEVEGFSREQNGPLKLRLELLESFMDKTLATNKPALESHTRAWAFEPGTLTIVDLSCPFVDEHAACALFSISLELFLENRGRSGRVVALDEAHKFMSSSPSAANFTSTLLDIIRQQRHLATRVIVATQEPTISPKLLDLASLTVVHRFTSPEWMHALRGHLAGASGALVEEAGCEHGNGNGAAGSAKRDLGRLFSEIVRLDAGEALVFSPSSMLEWREDGEEGGDEREGITDGLGGLNIGGLEEMGEVAVRGKNAGKKGTKGRGKGKTEEKSENGGGGRPVKMGMKYVKMRVRERLTTDGGRSVMAD